MKKRIVGLLVSIILVLTGIPTGAELIDVYGTKYEKAVRLLCDIGVLESVSPDYFEPGAQVKRSDAARYITALSGVLETGAVQIYTDVPPEHPAFGAVFLANQLGIVSGVGDGLFNPDGFVSAEQAAKMLVVLAGYQPHAEASGGYPSGYLAKANELDILKSVSTAEPFTKGELALMMYNTLFVIPAEKAAYGTESGKYVAEGENLLARNLHIYEVRGQVTANAITAVRGSAVREEEAAIEGVTYLAPDALAQKIGRKVVAYYKENEMGVKEIVSHTDAVGDTEFVTLEPKDILPGTSASTLMYQREEDSKPISVSLSGSTVVIYNGSVLGTVTAQDLQPAQGSVYITTEGNGDASVIVVENYSDFVVEDVNPDEGILYYKPNALGETGLNFMDPNVYYQITDAAGNAFDLQSCATGTVVSVMKSRDGKVCTLIACTETAQGVITEKTEEYVTVDGKAYAFSASFTGAVPALGENVLFALNYKGKVADNGANFSARKYGYLMMAVFEGKGLSRAAKVKLLTKENEIKVFTAAENIKINGVTIGGKLFNPDAVLTDAENAEVSKIFLDNTAVEQLIVYEENGAGEITAIQTAADRTAVFERDRDVFSLQFEADSGMFLAYGLRMFNSKYRIPADSIVFSVGEAYTGENDEQYKAMTGTALEHSHHYPGLKLYDFNGENEAAVMVTKLDMSDDAKTYTSDAVLVKSVSMAATEDGEVCEAVRIVGASGKEQTLYNPDEVKAVFSATAITDATKDPVAAEDDSLPSHISISQLQPGDVIKYSAVGGDLSSVIVCFRAGSPKEMEFAYEGKIRKYPSENNDYYQGLWVYGNVIYAGENGFRFYAKNHNGIARERIHTYGSATVLIFDKARQTVKVGKPASLTMGDAFFASRYNAAEKLIVIYR